MNQSPIVRKLIVESPNYELECVVEQLNRSEEKRLFVTGHYLMANNPNRNKRKYPGEDMKIAVESFKKDMIQTNRAGGTLNHESTADIDLGKLCHKIVSLEQDSKNPDLYIGKSLVLSSPSGKIFESLLKDGLKVGMSSRCLGRVVEESAYNTVKDIIILSVDAVYDPSIGGSYNDKDIGFVNGILENKEYIIADDGRIAEAFQRFEKSLEKYPSKYRADINKHILEGFKRLLVTINK
jgi:Prohead core protein serine protease